jgi:hypothetical protein
MIIIFNRVVYLTDEQYEGELKKREEYLRQTGKGTMTCPECNVTPVHAAPQGTGTATGGGTQ